MSAASRRVSIAAVLGAFALALPGLPAVAAESGVRADSEAAAPGYTVEKTGGITQLSDRGDVAEATGSVLFDSRTEGGAFRGKETRTLALSTATPSPAPADATAMILNVTAVAPTSSGWLTVWPSDQSRPTASTLNFAPGTPTPNLAVVRLGASRQFKVMNGSGGSTHVLISFRGWVRDNGGVQRPGSLTPTDATRVVDTRQTGPAVPAHGYRDVRVTGVGAPDGASAALLDVIAVKPTRAGYLIAHPSDTARPTSTALTYRVGGDRAALSLMRLSAAGKVRVWNMSSAPVHLVIDSFGWVAAGNSANTPAATAAIAPQRVLDTRASTGALTRGSPSVEVRVPGDGTSQLEGRPSAVVLAITATGATSGGHLQLDVDGSDWPDAGSMTPSIVNFGRGETVTNTTYVSVPDGGHLRLFAATGGSVHAVVDVVGLVRHRTELTGRLVTQDGGTPVYPGSVTTSPAGNLVPGTASDGTYRLTFNSFRATVNACGRAALPGGGPDPAYALGCVGGNNAPTAFTLAVGGAVHTGDVLVPRVGTLSGVVTRPEGSTTSLGFVTLRRSDGWYSFSAPVASAGTWKATGLPVGDWVVTALNVGSTLRGETIDEIPVEGQVTLSTMLAAGAKTFPVSAGTTTTADEAQLHEPGRLNWTIVDPDGDYSNVQFTVRHQSGYVVTTYQASPTTWSRLFRPGGYTVCATEGGVTRCNGDASSADTAPLLDVTSANTNPGVSTTITMP